MSINIQEIKPKKWTELRQVLDDMVDEADIGLHHTRITRVSEQRICFEGGSVICVFDAEEQQLLVWNRASKMSGGTMSLHQLVRLEAVAKEWYALHVNV